MHHSQTGSVAKVEPENFAVRKKKFLVWLLLAAGLAAAARWPLPSVAPGPIANEAPQPALARQGLHGEDSPASLPLRELLGKPRGAPFSSRSWVPPAASAPPPAVVDSSAQPSVPPSPYRVAGYVVQGDNSRIVLARGDRVFAASEGEALEKDYLVEVIAPDKVILLYLPTQARTTLVRGTPSTAPGSTQAALAGAVVPASSLLPEPIAQALRGPAPQRKLP